MKGAVSSLFLRSGSLPFCAPWLLLFVLLSGCGNEEDEGEIEEEDVPSTIVEGKLSGEQDGNVKLKERIGVFTYEEHVLADVPIQDGRFRMRFRSDSLDYVRLEAPNSSLLLHLRSGDSLFIRKGPRGGYRFEGKGSVRNRYLRDKESFKNSLSSDPDSLFGSGKGNFRRMLEERRNAFWAFRQKHYRGEGKEGLGKRFRELERARDRIHLAVLKFSFPDIHRYENPNDSVEFSESYWSYLDTIELNDPLLLKVPEFLNFAYDVANRSALENRQGKKDMGYSEILFRTIKEEFDGRVRDALLTYFILEQKRFAPKGVKESFLERFRKSVKDPRMRSFVKREFQRGA